MLAGGTWLEIARLIEIPMDLRVFFAGEWVRWAPWPLAAGAAAYAWAMSRQSKSQSAAFRRERRLREELEAYARLDATLAQGVGGRVDQVPAAKALAMRVCRTVAEKSSFTRVMMLLRNAEGGLRCVGSIGVDDLTVASVERWGEQVVLEERSASGGKGAARAGGKDGARKAPVLGPAGARSVQISLGEWEHFDREVGSWQMSGKRERRQWRRAIVFPVRTGAGYGAGRPAGRLVGALVVCADGLSLPGDVEPREQATEFRTDKLVSGLETLAARLGTAMENEALGDRLLRAEKLAGLGQLAGGVAHALNNPLTAVLGYADLLAETSAEPRVREDAQTIAAEALKMKATVQRLIEFWRPVTPTDEPVDLLQLVREVAAVWREELTQRGVKFEIVAHGQASEQTGPAARGCRQRLRQVVEHLLNNAVQAIAESRAREADEEHAIRISLSQDEHAANIIVSDTGTGFEEPGRAFDPFYTTKDPVEGAGLGLSICYGIVREHGGEISAFNLHPHGAAVVVELPLRQTVKDEARVLVRQKVAR
jgi:signal transduction histidine kinase